MFRFEIAFIEWVMKMRKILGKTTMGLLVLAQMGMAGNVPLGSYIGTFTNLDPNAGSYMQWTVQFGDPNVTSAIYYPFNMIFDIPPFESVSWNAVGAGVSVPAAIYQSCTATYCDGRVTAADYYIFTSPPPQFGYSQTWYFIDIYYPGTQTFNFTFTDPPPGPSPASVPVSLVSRNFLANGTQGGLPAGFSMTLNPDGTFSNVTATNMLLSGPGIGGGGGSAVPEPGTLAMVAAGLAAIWIGRRRRAVGLKQTAICVLGLGAMAAPGLRADVPFTYSPQGTQRVLVVMAEIPSPALVDPCPPASGDCRVDPQYRPFITGPRHTAAEWENLLNSAASTFWSQTTYGQTKFEFTVLKNPAKANGWWPIPFALNYYWRNCPNGGKAGCDNYTYFSNINPPSFPFVPAMAAYAIGGVCADPVNALVCGALFPNFNRLIVIQNYHHFGAQTSGQDEPLDILLQSPICLSSGCIAKLSMTSTWANEDSSDGRAVSAILHELGHQLGVPTHYGDCRGYIDDPKPPAPTTGNPDNCIGGSNDPANAGWDIMGVSPTVAQMTAYSRYSRGWLNESNARTFDLLGGPFAQNVTLWPLELAPVAGLPSFVRLSIGNPNLPLQHGYNLECRRRINGDAGLAALPGVGGLYDEGILITNIHEFSMSSIPGAPPIHMERPIFPFDAIANATLKPGDIWTYNPWGLSVRFNGYTDGGGCSVSVASLATLPPAPSRKVRFAGSVTPPWVSQPGKSTISADIGLDGLVFGAPFIGGPLPVNSLWPGHNNPVTVRVHAATPGTISNVNVGVKMSQPAVVASHCDVLPATTMSASIPEIPAAGNASTTMNWIAGTSGSVSVEAVATAPGNQALATTAYAYQFHHADALFNGQTTQFMVAADSSCGAPDMLYIRP